MKRVFILGIIFICLSSSSIFIGQISFNNSSSKPQTKLSGLAKLNNNKITSSLANEVFPRLALVKPVFTATAYSSFYQFYGSSNLDPHKYLSVPVIDGWGPSYGAHNIKTILVEAGYPGNKITTISDITVDLNQLFFPNGSRKYDTLMFFHSEYVSVPEYNNMLSFISSGGNVIIANGDAFFAEVVYNQSTNIVTLIRGHHVDFNGVNASWLDSYRFYNFFSNYENPKYIGSEYCNLRKGSFSGGTFHVDNLNPHPVSLDMLQRGIDIVAKNYSPHEDNCLLTKNADIIIDWHSTAPPRGQGFKMYETFPMGPFGGSLVHFGIFSSDIITQDHNFILTLIDVLRHQMGYFTTPWIRYPSDGGVYNQKNFFIDFTPNWHHDVYLNGTSLGDIPTKSSLGYLKEGTYNLTIVFHLLNQNVTRTTIFSIDRTIPQIEFNASNKVVYNIPQHPLDIKLLDKHPEDLSYCVYTNTTLPIARFCKLNEFYHVPGNSSTLDKLVYGALPNGTYYMAVKVYDSAGNFNESVFKFYVGQLGKNILKIERPMIDQINETTVKISIKPFAMNMSAYLLMTNSLVMSNNYSTWFKANFTKFDSNTNESYFYYTKPQNSSFFLYELFVYNSTMSNYIPQLNSFFWNNNVPSVSIPYTIQDQIKQNKSITISVHNKYDVHQNGSVYLINKDLNSNSQYITSFSSFQTDYNITFDLSSLNLVPGSYELKLDLQAGFNQTFNFPFIIESTNQQVIEPKVYGPILTYSTSSNPSYEVLLNYTINFSGFLYLKFSNSTYEKIDYNNSGVLNFLLYLKSQRTEVSIIEYNPISNIFSNSTYKFIHFIIPAPISSTTVTGSVSQTTTSIPMASDVPVNFAEPILIALSISAIIGVQLIIRIRKNRK